jgi:hypothetical protein
VFYGELFVWGGDVEHVMWRLGTLMIRRFGCRNAQAFIHLQGNEEKFINSSAIKSSFHIGIELSVD